MSRIKLYHPKSHIFKIYNISVHTVQKKENTKDPDIEWILPEKVRFRYVYNIKKKI